MTTSKKTQVALIALCALSFALMLGSSLHESAVVDELAHIPAGYAYLTRLDYRLNPEHPPLMKALAAIPLVFQHLEFPDTNPFWTTAVNGEWGVGGAFLFGLGNSAAAIIGWARLFPILLTIGLMLLAYAWARELFGGRWALLPVFLLAFSPIILANGPLVTTDIAAAFGALLSLYTFVKFMQKPNMKTIFLAAVGFGIAQVMKFSGLILVPVIFITLAFDFFASLAIDWHYEPFVAHRTRFFFGRFFKYLGYFLFICLVGFAVVVYPLYALFTASYPIARQVSDTASILGGLPSNPCTIVHLGACIAKFDVRAAGNPVLRPLAEYFLGVVMDYGRLTGGNTTYFLGHVYSYGVRLYFPVVYALKETLTALILTVLAALIGIWRALIAIARRKTHFARYIQEYLPQFSMLVFIVVYWAVSIESTLNIGIRHLLPVLPFTYLLVTSALQKWFTPVRARNTGNVGKGVFLGALLVWSLGETAFAYPHFLSYFNEIGGSTANGYHYVTDSNYDWGQDMLALQDWMNAHPQVGKLALDFFGGSNPAYYLGDKYMAWNASMGNPASQGIEYFAVSINNLQDAIQPAAPDYARAAGADYAWLTSMRPPASGMGNVPTPDYRVGTTIFIYKLY